MLRKISHIAITLLLLFATVGVVISQHYCNGSLVDTSIITETSKCCDMANGSCCHNESTFYQLDEQYVITHVQEAPKLIETALLFSIILVYTQPIGYDTDSNTEITESPPPKPISTSQFLSKVQCYLC